MGSASPSSPPLVFVYTVPQLGFLGVSYLPNRPVSLPKRSSSIVLFFPCLPPYLLRQVPVLVFFRSKTLLLHYRNFRSFFEFAPLSVGRQSLSKGPCLSCTCANFRKGGEVGSVGRTQIHQCGHPHAEIHTPRCPLFTLNTNTRTPNKSRKKGLREEDRSCGRYLNED